MSKFPSTLCFSGPHRICDEPAVLQSLGDGSAVYLWCMETPSGDFLVHYVGETSNIGARTASHYRNQLNGKSHAFCPDHLRKNLLVLAHRAGEGVVGVFEGYDPKIVNSNYIRALSLFVAELPGEYSRSDRCQFETALAYTVENAGQNILYISNLHKRRTKTKSADVDSGRSKLIALSGRTIQVGVA